MVLTSPDAFTHRAVGLSLSRGIVDKAVDGRGYVDKA